MSMTLPRWFGRRTKKKSGKKADETEAIENESKTDLNEATINSPGKYIEKEKFGNQNHAMRFDTFRTNQGDYNYVQTQDIYSHQLKDAIQESYTENDIHNTSNGIYQNRESSLKMCSLAQHEVQNHISPAIYGGRYEFMV